MNVYIANLLEGRQPTDTLRRCACCRDWLHPDDFDITDFRPDHVRAMTQEYGGECCFLCTDATPLCDCCGNLVERVNGDGECDACEARSDASRRAYISQARVR